VLKPSGVLGGSSWVFSWRTGELQGVAVAARSVVERLVDIVVLAPELILR
jgi:hypothetical protein